MKYIEFENDFDGFGNTYQKILFVIFSTSEPTFVFKIMLEMACAITAIPKMIFLEFRVKKNLI